MVLQDARLLAGKKYGKDVLPVQLSIFDRPAGDHVRCHTTSGLAAGILLYPAAATYQLQHWAGATGKTVLSDMSQSNPGWTNYATLHNNRTGDTGRMVDYIIRRLGDL